MSFDPVKVLSVASEATKYMRGYETREDVRRFGEDILYRWSRGHMDDQDFRQRLASLAVAPVHAD